MSSSSALFAPVDNLLSSVFALVSNPTNPIKAIDNIMRQPKDEHGNILIALDDKNMSLWRAGVQKLVPNAVFKPIVIVTNPEVIKALLNELKSDASSHFAGNPSTDTIGSLVGTDNIFASTSGSVHGEHKQAFKNYLSDKEANIALIAPVIQAWVATMSRRCIKDMDFELLAASVMLTFLLDRDLAFDSKSVADIITLKRHFVRTATLSDGVARFFDGYEMAKKRLVAAITERYQSDKSSYIKSLKSQFDLQQTISHILSLMMVGFDNLRSSLISTVIHLAKHPEYRLILSKDMQHVGTNATAFFDFELLGRENAASQFFAEAVQQTPPVWLQARVNKAESSINYRDENGEHSFVLPSAALVLIPNLHLALMHKHDAIKPSELFPHPFSIGPNACPGRPIAYTANGVLIAEIIKNNLALALSPYSRNRHDPKVALSLKDLQIYVGYTAEESKRFIARDQVAIDINPTALIVLTLAAGLLTGAVSSYEKNSVSLSIILSLAAMAMTGMFCHVWREYEMSDAMNLGADALQTAPRLG